MIDTNTVLRTFLLAQAALTAEVGIRIYGIDLPKAECEAMPRKTICFFTRGGSGELYTPLIEPSVQFKCFGASHLEAREVYRALHDVLHSIGNQSVGNARILEAQEESQGQDLTDPDVYWPYVLCFYRILFRTEEVP